MPRKSKNENPGVVSASSPANEEQSPPENMVDVEIDQHSESDDLLQSAARMVGSFTAQKRPHKTETDQRYYARKKAGLVGSKSQDFSTIIVTLMTLALSAWQAPEEVKPNDDEVQAFSVPATRMLLRHVPIASKLSADALDVIGMIGALSAYSVRTRKDWAKYNEEKRALAQVEKEKASAIIPTWQPITPVQDQSLDDGFHFPQPMTPVTEEGTL